jgi:hypothetical protein
MKHTPFPWTLRIPPREIADRQREHMRRYGTVSPDVLWTAIVKGDNGRVVVGIFPGTTDKAADFDRAIEEAEGNARLLHIVPSLIESLQRIRDLADKHAESTGQPVDFILTIANEALAQVSRGGR